MIGIQVKTATLALLFSSDGTVNAKKCPFGHGETSSQETDSETISKEHPKVKSTTYTYLEEIFPCTQAITITTTPAGKMDGLYKLIANEVIAQYDAITTDFGDNENLRGTFAGCTVRAAGHDFMDFRYNTDGTTYGGSDGCINFTDEDNEGLGECLVTANMPTVYNNYCHKVSLADFIVIMGEATMGRTTVDYNAADPYATGTYLATLKEAFQFGRTTAPTCSWNVGFMPNPEDGCTGLEEIFVDNIYKAHAYPWRMTAAISGSHTLGSAKLENSGYEGFWSSSERQGQFTNDYYVSMMLKGWGPELAMDGNTLKNQWQNVDNFNQEDQVHKQMMLDTDMCLGYRNNKPFVECEDTYGQDADECVEFAGLGDYLKATTGECCAWSRKQTLFQYGGMTKNTDDYNAFEFCHTYVDQIVSGEGVCCFNIGDDTYGDCDERVGSGPAYQDIYDFIGSEAVWLTAFHESWTMATQNGYSTLYAMEIGDDVDDVVEVVEATDAWGRTCEWYDVPLPVPCLRNDPSVRELMNCFHTWFSCNYEDGTIYN